MGHRRATKYVDACLDFLLACLEEDGIELVTEAERVGAERRGRVVVEVAPDAVVLEDHLGRLDGLALGDDDELGEEEVRVGPLYAVD